MSTIPGHDAVVIDQPASEQAKSDAISMLRKDKGAKLRLAIDATHSGVITNGRVYTSRYVSTGYKSFFSKDNGGSAEYDKPVLLHHADHMDPVGRVMGGRYTALKVGDEFEKDYLNPDQTGSKGSGVVSIDCVVSDPSAIEKIIDGRYLSVSAGHSTNRMTCSICGNNLVGHDSCEHLPGSMYSLGEDDDDGDQFLCFGITHRMTYHEVSFVNHPAQPPSKVINFNWEDSKSPDFWKTDSLSETILSMTRGRKDIVRDMVLCDQDVEFSLLTGKEKKKVSRTVVSVPPSAVDLLTQALESDAESLAEGTPHDHKEIRHPGHKEASVKDGSGEKGETTQGRHSDPDSSSADGDSRAEQQKDDRKKSTDQKKDATGEPNMTDTDKNVSEPLSENAWKASIEALTSERDEQKALITSITTEKDAEIERLKSTNETQAAEIKRLTDDAVGRNSEMARQLANCVASQRVMLRKPDALELDSKESFQTFVEGLAERSVDSLLDSINDHALELAQLPEFKDKEDTKDDSVSKGNEAISGDQVKSPVLGVKNGRDKVKTVSSKTDVLESL